MRNGTLLRTHLNNDHDHFDHPQTSDEWRATHVRPGTGRESAHQALDRSRQSDEFVDD